MTSEEIQKLKALIVATAMYYGHDVPDQVLALYVEDLRDLPLDQIANALREVRRDPKTNRFPLPAIIRDRITPADTDEINAVDAVSRIIEAVASCGWPNHERAKARIGELGWRVVEMEGGWMNICKSLNDENKGVLRAQWKSMALSQIRRAKLGLVTGPALPFPKNEGGLVRLSDSIGLLRKENA